MPGRSEQPRYSSLHRLCIGLALLLTLSLSLPAAAQTPTPPGGPGPNRKYDVTHINLADGYRIEPVVINLSVPTTAVFDGPDLLVAESGWANTAPARVLRITPDWQVTVVVTAGLEGPVTGLLVKDDQLYVSHRGKVSVVEGGTLRDIVTGLPSHGDHQNNNLVLGPDGKIYLGQGTTTNAAVVGADNYIFGWLGENPTIHEIPCQDITLVGTNFESENPLTTDPNDRVTTGAYKPFGTASQPGEVIKGNVKCGGSIARFNPDGSNYELVAWGLRNPFGLEFDQGGQLWATYHGADVRGSRNIFNDPDYLVRVEQDAWYGWPEYFAGEPVTASRFTAPTKPQPQFLWQDHPPLAKPFAMFETHEAINGLAFSPGGAFGFAGDAFVAMFGTFTPVSTGVNIQPVGFRVVRVDMQTAQGHDFASNNVPGPSYVNQTLGFDRPSDVVFAPDESLYVVDWGASTLTPEGLKLQPLTGTVWRIYPTGGQAVRPDGALRVEAAPPIAPENRKPEVANVPDLYQMLASPLVLICGVLLLIVLALGVLWRLARRPAGVR